MADFHRLSHIQGVVDDDTLNLDGADASVTAVVDGSPYLFVGGNYDGISAFSIATDGTLTGVSNASSDATLSGITSLATADVSGTTYLFASGEISGSVKVFSVGSDGSLLIVETVVDDGTLNLDFASAVTTVTVDGSSYLIVAGVNDDGVSTFQIGSDGMLTNIANVDESGGTDFNLYAVTAITTAEVELGHVSLRRRWGRRHQRLRGPVGGTLSHIGNILDSTDSSFNLGYIIYLTTADVDGTTYLFAASDGDGIGVFSVGSGGVLTIPTTCLPARTWDSHKPSASPRPSSTALPTSW